MNQKNPNEPHEPSHLPNGKIAALSPGVQTQRKRQAVAGLILSGLAVAALAGVIVCISVDFLEMFAGVMLFSCAAAASAAVGLIFGARNLRRFPAVAIPAFVLGILIAWAALIFMFGGLLLYAAGPFY